MNLRMKRRARRACAMGLGLVGLVWGGGAGCNAVGNNGSSGTFGAKCAGCHGATGTGLTGPNIRGVTATQIAAAMRQPPMTSINPTQAEIDEIVQFLSQ